MKWKLYAAWILFVETVGALSGWLTRKGTKRYSEAVVQPPLSPPAIVFSIVWGILFALMGISAARVCLAPRSRARTRGLWLFFLQLAFNFFWSFLFFQFRAFGGALIWLLVLWALILGMIFVFHRVDPPTAWLQLPYLFWVTFAAYLNFGVWQLNR